MRRYWQINVGRFNNGGGYSQGSIPIVIKLYWMEVLTPTRRGYDENRYHFFRNDWRLWGRRRANERLDVDVRPQQRSRWRHFWRLSSRAPHHHAEGKLFLEHRLQIHHVQVRHDSTIYHHNFVTFDDTWTEHQKFRFQILYLNMPYIIAASCNLTNNAPISTFQLRQGSDRGEYVLRSLK